MAAAAIPVAMLASAAISRVGSGKSSQEKGLINTQTQNAAQAGQQGKDLYNFGMPMLQRSASYYGTLLGGNRAQQAQLLQPEISNITDLYRGAEKNLEQSGVRGGVKDTAVAEMSRERSGRIAGLVPGLRPMAASALSGIGQFGASGGQAGTSLSSNISGSLLGQAQSGRQFDTAQSYQQGTDWGQMIGTLLQQQGTKGKKTSAGAYDPFA